MPESDVPSQQEASGRSLSRPTNSERSRLVPGSPPTTADAVTLHGHRLDSARRRPGSLSATRSHVGPIASSARRSPGFGDKTPAATDEASVRPTSMRSANASALGSRISRSRLTVLLSEQEVAPFVPLVDGGIVVFRQLIAYATVIHVVWIPVSAVS